MEGVLVLVTGACLATVAVVAAWLVHARSPGTVTVRGAAVPAAAARRTASFRLAGVIAGLAAAAAPAGQGAVSRRARPGVDAATVAAGDALRRRAARTIPGACGILVALPLAGVCLVSAGALLSISCHPAWWTYAGWALLALLISAVALMSWCAAVLLAPARAATAAPPAR